MISILELKEIELYHPFNKERRKVPVELIRPTFIAIRWGQSGIYDLNLTANVLTARSKKAQNKGRCHWQAYDIEKIRLAVTAHFNNQLADTVAKELIAHKASMPGK